MMEPGVGEVEIPGSPEPAYVVTPQTSSGAGILFLHWFDESPRANRTQYLEEARTLAALGAASILPQLAFPWHSDPTDLASDRDRIQSELTTLHHTLEALRAIDGVDPTRTAVVGHDFGAMYGCLLMSGFEAACGVLVAPTPRWSDWFLPFWPIQGDRYDYMRGLSELDPIGAVGEVHAPLLFQFAKLDFYIAPMTGSEMFRSANEPKQLVSYEAGHDLDLEDVRRDRLRFLTQHLGLDG